MRWVLVKLVNLLIVLVIVTFIVVAIFAGPMAEIEKMRLEDVIRQQVMRDTTIPSELKFKIVQKRLQEAITARGLDKPWYHHALRYMKNLLLLKPLNATVLASGYWHQGSRNVHYIIGERIPFSILLFTTSAIFTLLFSIPLALYAARRPGSIVDNLITSWSVLSVSMPWWWVASNVWFQKLTPEQQQIVRESVEVARKYGEQVEREKDKFYAEELKKKGMIFIEPDIEAFKRALKPAILAEVKRLHPDVQKAILKYLPQ